MNGCFQGKQVCHFHSLPFKLANSFLQQTALEMAKPLWVLAVLSATVKILWNFACSGCNRVKNYGDLVVLNAIGLHLYTVLAVLSAIGLRVYSILDIFDVN